jgi:hypothetical protein
MGNNMSRNNWLLTQDGFDVRTAQAFEGLFTVGSGYLHTRGSLKEHFADCPQNTLDDLSPLDLGKAAPGAMAASKPRAISNGQPGLLGGQTPEAETFSVRFLGSDKPGDYQATIRIVTQAGNVGTLSLGGDGEPPVNLYYVDIPVRVRVP